MGFKASLEGVLKVEGAKIGLGDAKAEEIKLGGASGRRGELHRTNQGDHSVVKVVSHVEVDEYVNVAVVSADTYEIEYLDTEEVDKDRTTHVQYTHGTVTFDEKEKKWYRGECEVDEKEWIDLKTAHVFKYRKGIVEMSEELKTVTFRVLNKAIPKDGVINVEVHLGVSKFDKEVPEDE